MPRIERLHHYDGGIGQNRFVEPRRPVQRPGLCLKKIQYSDTQLICRRIQESTGSVTSGSLRLCILALKFDADTDSNDPGKYAG